MWSDLTQAPSAEIVWSEGGRTVNIGTLRLPLKVGDSGMLIEEQFSGLSMRGSAVAKERNTLAKAAHEYAHA